MKLISLQVESFGQLKDCSLEFGDHLNVVYAPNGFGKSTLVDAIRAALLLQSTSAEHKKWIPWGTQDAPKVELVIQPEPMRYFRIKKKFGTSGTAILEQSKDNVSYSKKTSGRAVDGELRKMLRWGIPEPGKGGGSRGLPSSFMTSVLLPRQEEVMSVVGDGIAQDKDETGKQLLNEALQAMATDPAFSDVLARVQSKVDEAYTATGRKRSGQSSPFKAVSDEIKRVTENVSELEKDYQESQSVQTEIASLHTRLQEQQVALEQQTTKLKKMNEAWSSFEAVKKKATTAKQQFEKLQQKHSEIAELQQQVEQLTKTAAEKSEQHQQLTAELNKAEQEVKAATEAQRQATSDNAVAQKKIRKQEIENELLQLQAKLKEHETRQTKTNEQLKRLEQYGECQKRVGELETALKELAEKIETNDGQLTIFDGIRAWHRVETAKANVASLAEQTKNVEALREQLTDKRAQLKGLASDDSDLPTVEEIRRFRDLERQIEITKAQADAKLSVRVEPQKDFDLSITTDGGNTESQNVTEPLEINASLSMDLEIAGLANFKISAGDPDAASELADLQKQWTNEVAPQLERCKVSSLMELADLRTQFDERETKRKTLATGVQQLENQLETLSAIEQTSQSAATKLADAEQEFSEFDEASLATHVQLLSQYPLNEREDAIEQLRSQSQTDLVNLKSEEAQKKQQLKNERCTLESLESDDTNSLDETTIRAEQQAIATSLTAAKASVEQRQKELTTLDDGADELQKLDANLKQAKVRVDELSESLQKLSTDLATAKEHRDKKEGELKSQQRDFPADELKTAKRSLDEAREAEQTVLADWPELSETTLAEEREEQQRLQSTVNATNAEFLQKQGGLKQVAGDIARERFEQERQALDLKKQQEEDLELEYEGYRLLLDTLREAENSEASHLGQAIADPINERVSELTGGLFGNLQLGPSMETQGIEVEGETRDLDRLSLGTREQISTLMRLSLAAEMESVLVLDDQLTQSDPIRMNWFREAMRSSSEKHQIIVFTCRPEDYLSVSELPACDWYDSGVVRAINLALLK